MDDVKASAALETPQDCDETHKIVFLHSTPLVNDGGISIPLLDVERDEEELRQVVSESRKEVRFLSVPATTTNIVHAISSGATILHYAGHGGVGPPGATGMVALETQTGGLTALDEKSLSLLLATRGRSKIKLAFVAACHSEHTGRVFANAGIKHVIAVKHKDKITDSHARFFTHEFYKHLLNGESVNDSFQMALVTLNLEFTNQDSEVGKKFLLLPLATHDERLFKDQKVGDIIYESRHSCFVFPEPRLNPVFIGRNSNMQIIYKYFRERNRLVTVNGRHGIGKSAIVFQTVNYMAKRDLFDIIIQIVFSKAPLERSYTDSDILDAITTSTPHLKSLGVTIPDVAALVDQLNNGSFLDALCKEGALEAHLSSRTSAEGTQGGEEGSARALADAKGERRKLRRVLFVFDGCDAFLAPSPDSSCSSTLSSAMRSYPSVLAKFIDAVLQGSQNSHFLLTSEEPLYPVRTLAPTVVADTAASMESSPSPRSERKVSATHFIPRFRFNQRIVTVNGMAGEEICRLLGHLSPKQLSQQEVMACIPPVALTESVLMSNPSTHQKEHIQREFARAPVIEALGGNPLAAYIFAKGYLPSQQLSTSAECVNAARAALTQAEGSWDWDYSDEWRLNGVSDDETSYYTIVDIHSDVSGAPVVEAVLIHNNIEAVGDGGIIERIDAMSISTRRPAAAAVVAAAVLDDPDDEIKYSLQCSRVVEVAVQPTTQTRHQPPPAMDSPDSQANEQPSQAGDSSDSPLEVDESQAAVRKDQERQQSDLIDPDTDVEESEAASESLYSGCCVVVDGEAIGLEIARLKANKIFESAGGNCEPEYVDMWARLTKTVTAPYTPADYVYWPGLCELLCAQVDRLLNDVHTGDDSGTTVEAFTCTAAPLGDGGSGGDKEGITAGGYRSSHRVDEPSMGNGAAGKVGGGVGTAQSGQQVGSQSGAAAASASGTQGRGSELSYTDDVVNFATSAVAIAVEGKGEIVKEVAEGKVKEAAVESIDDDHSVVKDVISLPSVARRPPRALLPSELAFITNKMRSLMHAPDSTPYADLRVDVPAFQSFLLWWHPVTCMIIAMRLEYASYAPVLVHGFLDRRTAESLLLGQLPAAASAPVAQLVIHRAPGLFLLRFSGTRNGELAVSFIDDKAPGGRSKVEHCTILFDPATSLFEIHNTTIRSAYIGEILSKLGKLLVVFPNIPKNEAFDGF